MKYIFLLALFIVFLATPVIAGRGGEPNRRASPHVTPSCSSEYMSASLSGTFIEATLAPGEQVVGFVTYYNRTEGQQWVVTSVRYVTDQEQLELPADWVVFVPSAFCLEANTSQVTEITVAVPKKATPGEYRALLAFTVSSEGGSVGVGAAVAIWAKITVE